MAKAKPVVLDEVYEGTTIGQSYLKRPRWFRVLVGVPLIYVPILVSLPFILLGIMFVRMHLRALGAHGMKSYWDFVPEKASHRYAHATQPVYNNNPFAIVHYKWFWLFNCRMYCPMTVAMLRYYTYLIKIVENWWCPFEHSRKHEYADAQIDASFWHLRKKHRDILHPDDRDNPIWNKNKRK